jgi:hypothetical protein
MASNDFRKQSRNSPTKSIGAIPIDQRSGCECTYVARTRRQRRRFHESYHPAQQQVGGLEKYRIDHYSEEASDDRQASEQKLVNEWKT